MKNFKSLMQFYKDNFKIYLSFLAIHITLQILVNIIFDMILWSNISLFSIYWLSLFLPYNFKWDDKFVSFNGKFDEDEKVIEEFDVSSFAYGMMKYKLLLTNKSIIIINKYKFNNYDFRIYLDEIFSIESHKKSIVISIKYKNDIHFFNKDAIKLKEKILNQKETHKEELSQAGIVA